MCTFYQSTPPSLKEAQRTQKLKAKGEKERAYYLVVDLLKEEKVVEGLITGSLVRIPSRRDSARNKEKGRSALYSLLDFP